MWKWLQHGLLLTAFSLLVSIGLGAAVLHLHKQQILTVESASMVPTFYRGDALIVSPVKSSELKPGQIISYRSPHNASLIISHRLIEVKSSKLITSGDALGTMDEPFNSNRVVGRPIAIAPKLGYMIDFMRRPIGLITLIFIPGLLIIINEIIRLYKSLTFKRYVLKKL